MIQIYDRSECYLGVLRLFAALTVSDLCLRRPLETAIKTIIIAEFRIKPHVEADRQFFAIPTLRNEK